MALKLPAKVKKKATQVNKGYFLEERSAQITYEQAMPVFDFLNYSNEEIGDTIGLNASTVSRYRKKKNTLLDKPKSVVVNMYDEVIKMGVESFGSQEEFLKWLHQPNLAMGNKTPAEVLQNPADTEIVEDAIHAMEWGNYL
jgi:putative toxin-antitoxin system antitoxin component (TIGR02293 family)